MRGVSAIAVIHLPDRLAALVDLRVGDSKHLDSADWLTLSIRGKFRNLVISRTSAECATGNGCADNPRRKRLHADALQTPQHEHMRAAAGSCAK
jgi:hypothetical protein